MFYKRLGFIFRNMVEVNVPQLDFRNKIIMAPMVRIGTLPGRLLALEMGADLVYSEELIDLKLINCQRSINDVLGTVDYIDPTDGCVVFRTCKAEKSAVVMQIGTNDPDRALAVGQFVQNDIAALDVNMGCPKEFSIKGGMGAALLSQPDKAVNILKNLVNNLKIAVTCKIRILPKLEDTIELVKKLSSTGIAAITIHARTINERPQNEPHIDFIREIVKHVDIPVIANGGSRHIKQYEDICKFRNACDASSVMVARAAQLNPSIFRKEGLLPMDDIIEKYLTLSVDFDNPPHNTKYGVQSILHSLQMTPKGKQFLACQTMQQMCDLWNLGDYCRNKENEFYEKKEFKRRRIFSSSQLHFNGNYECNEASNCKSDSENLDISSNKNIKPDANLIEENIAFLHSNFNSGIDNFPKSILYKYACKSRKTLPVYHTHGKNKLFRSFCTFDGKRYTSAYWQKNKRQAEQAAALVCLKNLNLILVDDLIKTGSIKRQ